MGRNFKEPHPQGRACYAPSDRVHQFLALKLDSLDALIPQPVLFISSDFQKPLETPEIIKDL